MIGRTGQFRTEPDGRKSLGDKYGCQGKRWDKGKWASGFTYIVGHSREKRVASTVTAKEIVPEVGEGKPSPVLKYVGALKRGKLDHQSDNAEGVHNT